MAAADVSQESDTRVEIGRQRHRQAAGSDRLRQLLHADLVLRQDHHSPHPFHLGGIRRHGGGGIAGRGAGDLPHAEVTRPGDAGAHAAILERQRRVLTLVLDAHVARTGDLLKPFRRVKVGIAFRLGDDVPRRKVGQDELVVPPDAAPGGTACLAQAGVEQSPPGRAVTRFLQAVEIVGDLQEGGAGIALVADLVERVVAAAVDAAQPR